MKCKKCGKVLPENAKFCLECGTKVEKELVCPTCGMKLPVESKFCMECGCSVTKQSYESKKADNEQGFDVNKMCGHKVEPSSVTFIHDEVEFQEISTGERLAYVRDNKSQLMGVINSEYEVVIPFIFYDYYFDSLERVSTNTIGQYPELAMEPTEECRGWGRIFINRSLDIRFDVGSQEEFYEQYPAGKAWIQKYISILGREIQDRSGTVRELEV